MDARGAVFSYHEAKRQAGRSTSLHRATITAGSIMSKTFNLTLDLDLPEARGGDPALRLAEELILRVLPRLADEAGIEKHRLAGSLLVELGYVVGLSHTPAAAVDALAVATERLRDALAGRRDPRPALPAPTVAGPTTLQ